MKARLPLLGVCLLLTASVSRLPAATRPNVLFILADDLGYGDTGPTFQNERAARQEPAFATPGFDALAQEGVTLRNHYSAAPVCAPSRASLLAGLTQGHANVRDNQFDKGLADNHTLATVMRAAGYATAAIGKWGLQGDPTDRLPGAAKLEEAEPVHGRPDGWPAYPLKRGFDFYFGYVRHKDGHFHYPKEDHREIWENDREISGQLDNCYTADLFTARAKKWIVEQRAAHPEQPFFMYLAYDTPHAKLQYPPCVYPEGGGVHGGVQWLGQSGAMLNTARGTVDGWCDPAVAAARWDEDRNPATPSVPWPDVQKRHATAVRRLATAVADLRQLLRDLGIDRDTLVIFTSDNGPARESYLKNEPFEPNFFHGFGPFDGIKRDAWEGGIREPTFAVWPGRIPAGREVRTPSGMWDWLATLATVAGQPVPAASDGVSLLPDLTGEGRRAPSDIYVEYFFASEKTPAYPEFVPAHRNRARRQMQVVMVDGYTGVRYDVQSWRDDFEIYDVQNDPQQRRNLAGERKLDAVQTLMKARALQLRRPNRSAPRPYDEAAVPADAPASLVSGGLLCTGYDGNWPWVPDFSTLEPVSTQRVTSIEAPAGSGPGHAGLAFTGYFHAAEEGEYTFAVSDDGGAELFLHGARVIDDDFHHTGAEVQGTIRLAAGWHPLRLYYRHGTGERRLTVRYALAGKPLQPIPAESLAAVSP